MEMRDSETIVKNTFTGLSAHGRDEADKAMGPDITFDEHVLRESQLKHSLSFGHKLTLTGIRSQESVASVTESLNCTSFR